eukprot:1159101-Pelagomonas_calceolata.AAC.1
MKGMHGVLDLVEAAALVDCCALVPGRVVPLIPIMHRLEGNIAKEAIMWQHTEHITKELSSASISSPPQLWFDDQGWEILMQPKECLDIMGCPKISHGLSCCTQG